MSETTEFKPCNTCKYHVDVLFTYPVDICHHPLSQHYRSPVNGNWHLHPCLKMRDKYFPCKVEGLLWEEKPSAWKAIKLYVKSKIKS